MECTQMCHTVPGQKAHGLGAVASAVGYGGSSRYVVPDRKRLGEDIVSHKLLRNEWNSRLGHSD